MMMDRATAALKAASPYTAVITREQFLFYELRVTARLLADGLTESEVVGRIVDGNLFQYPTERSVRRMALAALRRLAVLDDPTLVRAIAEESADVARQLALYAMMRQHRIVWDFMISVIGAKYRACDMSFSRRDLNSYFLRLQEQDDWVATWSDTTIAKLKQVLVKLLVDCEYLASPRACLLNPVWLYPILDNAIRARGEEAILAAFNCFT